MRKAFTLMEVLVAVGIISVVVIGLLSSNSTNGKLSQRLSGQFHEKEQFSIILLNANENFHNTEKSLYDFLEKKFHIKNADLRRWLKEQKVEYTDKEFSQVKLLDLDESYFKDIAVLTGGAFDKSSLPDLVFNIQKVQASNHKASTIGYTFNIR